MTSRERILTALDHREPDRVPIDFGSCGPTAIHVNAYTSLLAHFGITEKIALWDLVGQLAQPSEYVLELLGADACAQHRSRCVRRECVGDGASRATVGHVSHSLIEE